MVFVDDAVEDPSPAYGYLDRDDSGWVVFGWMLVEALA
jgi:hypothetical protein